MLVLVFPKGELHLNMNHGHTAFLDAFFKNITWLGSGWMVLVLALGLLFVRFRDAVVFLAGNLVITVFVQGGKHLVFPHALRPVAWFQGHDVLHLVQGVHMHLYHSFPSGHSATALGVFVILVYLTRNKPLKFLWLLLALLTAFSRVYLSQHFMEDIVAGSMIGFAGMLVTVYYFDRNFSDFCNRSVLKCFSHKKKV